MRSSTYDASSSDGDRHDIGPSGDVETEAFVLSFDGAPENSEYEWKLHSMGLFPCPIFSSVADNRQLHFQTSVMDIKGCDDDGG